MMQIALPNQGKVDAGDLFPATETGTSRGGSSDFAPYPRGEGEGTFPDLFAKMVNKASQTEDAAASSNVRNTDGAENIDAGPDLSEEQRQSDLLIKGEGFPPGGKQDAEPSTVIGENPDGHAGSQEAGQSLPSYLPGMASALEKQGLKIGVSGTGANGPETISTGGHGEIETIPQAVDQPVSVGGNPSRDGTDKGNKILLTLPQDFLKGYVVNENGQPHFSPNGSLDGRNLSAEATGLDGESNMPQLVRLNTQASSSSPQGILLAAAMGVQKTQSSHQAGAKAGPENMDAGEAVPGNPASGEAVLKANGEHRVRETLLYPEAGHEPDGTAVKTGTDPRMELLSSEAELEEQARITAELALEEGKASVAVREDAMKGARLIAGKESVQWVPYAGASSPQVPPGAAAPAKGVFIPMNEVVSKAGTVLEKGGKVQMTLQPPSLGTIGMEVVVQNNRVELVLTTGHTDVQQMLQAGTDQLKNALQSQGFQVDQMSVLLRQENFGFNPGENPLWQNGSGQKQDNGNGSSALPETPDAGPVIPRNDGGTGTISIFA